MIGALFHRKSNVHRSTNLENANELITFCHECIFLSPQVRRVTFQSGEHCANQLHSISKAINYNMDSRTLSVTFSHECNPSSFSRQDRPTEWNHAVTLSLSRALPAVDSSVTVNVSQWRVAGVRGKFSLAIPIALASHGVVRDRCARLCGMRDDQERE